MHRSYVLALAVLAGLCPSALLAQEAMYTNAATMPGPGSAILRTQYHAYNFGRGPEEGLESSTTHALEASLQLGIAPAWSLTTDVVYEIDDEQQLDAFGGDSSSDANLSMVDFTFKHRFYLNNPGGLDTQRAAFMFGAAVDTEDGKNVDPHLGIVWTQVIGRSGWNFELHYILTTGGTSDRLDNKHGGEGSADALLGNIAYVYRVWPAAFTSDSTGAYYVTAELNTIYETNGDTEVRFSPGFMFEGRHFGWEIMGQLPVFDDLDERGELDWALGAGLRFLF
jgi:hypothetical protein